jgi:hypothetical protein
LLGVCLIGNASDNDSEVKAIKIDTPNGFEVHADVPPGMTSITTLNKKEAFVAHFTFELNRLQGSKNWPAGANFSFFSKDRKNSFHTAFLIDSSINENVIIAIKVIENEKLTGSDYFPIDAFSLEDVAVGFRWDQKKISMQYNGNPLTELIKLPDEIETLTFGLQSSSGVISVELPNKPFKQDK